MTFARTGLVPAPLLHAVVVGVGSVLSCLVLRFAVRDGVTGHTLGLERRRPPSSIAPRSGRVAPTLAR